MASWTLYILAFIAFIAIVIAAGLAFYAGSQLNNNVTTNNVVTTNGNNIQNARNASWGAGAASVVAALFIIFVWIVAAFYPGTTVTQPPAQTVVLA